METNCCLLVGNFKNEKEFLNYFASPSNYINLMIDFNKKVVEPNNCDIFIYTDYNADYELKNPPALTESNIDIFHNNLKKIFKNKLKSFKIQSTEFLKKPDTSNFFYSNINNDKNNKFNLTLENNAICFQTFKLMKNYDICKKYELDNNVKYNKYFVVRPDFSIQHTLLFEQFDNNIIHIAFNSWLLFNDNITLEKYIHEFTENLEKHCLEVKSLDLSLCRENIQMNICKCITKFKTYHYNTYGSTADCRRCHPYLKSFYSEEDIQFFSKQIDEIN
jgi:hypothetical protein